MRYVALIVCLVACTKKSEPALNLVVAASLGPAAQTLSTRLAKEGVKINVHAGASSLVARQIVNGLPCDVVILADNEWMDFLAAHAAIDPSSRRLFLGNELVWIKRKGKNVENNRIALADPEHVPAGKYAKAALIAQNKWTSIAPRVVPASDVRTALLWVERGEVDEAVVYATDARSSSNVEVVAKLKSVNPIGYPIASCRSEKSKRLAFILESESAKSLFRESGFVVHD